MVKYICQDCGHVSGYHKTIQEEDGVRYGKCIINDCNCEKFKWDDEQFEEVNKKIEEKAKDGGVR